MSALTISPAGPLSGTITVPGDKSITHRAFILSALAEGTSTITGFSTGEDCLNTLRALQALGIPMTVHPDSMEVTGKGLWGLTEPTQPLDFGNSGTGFRLLSGILAAQDFFTVLTGDESLSSRPMGRVVTPLRKMGATITGRKGGDLAPLAISGTKLQAIDYSSPVSSAQVKSCVLLAGLFAQGTTRFTEPQLSRDHTERMFQYLGIPFQKQDLTLHLTGGQSFQAKDLSVPGDLSAAAFFLVGGSIVPHSDICIRNIGMNPARTGIVDILQRMGANISILNEREEAGEPVADLRVQSAPLRGITITKEQVPQSIDEFPIICVAAALAQGRTVVSGAEELHVKETDRIEAMVQELTKLGVNIQGTPDGFSIEGKSTIHGATCTSYGDHRVAMSLAIAALTGNSPTTIDNASCIDTSFPGFHGKLLELLTNS
ncbi:MAG: 3-phosphoshikimate 1-carboxyvinyltransferase [Nitrospirae bacterium]|nr:3-phosphoshikimate 1-carboxyvinyltransferase [Nitrospirota bacterium]